MPCQCCRCTQTSSPTVYNLFDSLAISDFEENTLVLPSSRNHTLDNVLNQTTERMIDLIPVQKKRQFYGRSNASSAGLVAAFRWTSTNDVDDSEATLIDQMKEAAQKAYQSLNQPVYQSTSQASKQRNLQSSTATTLSNSSSSSSGPRIIISPEASLSQSHNQPSNQSNNHQPSHSNQHSQCPCACHYHLDSQNAKVDENLNTLNIPSNKSPRNQQTKHSHFNLNNQSNNRSTNQSTLPSPVNSRPGTASRPATGMSKSDTAIYRGGQTKMTEDELMEPSAKLDRALDELARSVQDLSSDPSVNQSINPSNSSSSKKKKKKAVLSPVKKGLSDDQKAAALARRAVRQVEMERKKREDAIKLAQVKADDKFYHEMMLKQYERRVKMQEFQRRHESQRAERLRQSNDSNLPSRSLSRSTDSFAPSRSFSHRFQPHSSASIVNEKPVFAEFGATNTRTKVKAHYMKTHNITPDLPPNQAREAQSYTQARRAAINQLHQREAAIARLSNSFRVETSVRDRKIEQMARSFPPPVYNQSHQSIDQQNNQSQLYRVVRHPYPSVNHMNNSMNQSIATVANDPIRMYQHQAEA